jgi:hypothetical protein
MRVNRIALYAGLLALVVHLAVNPHYGFFRDELYFIICGRHPAFGYVDQPPLVPLLAAWSQSLGQSLFAIRAVAALFAGGGVYVTCLLVEELGGTEFAQWFAAFITAVTPVLAAFGSRLCTDDPGLLLWPLIALGVLRAIGGNPRWWLIAGAAFGIACEAKYTVFFYAAALVAGLILSGQARALGNRWFFAGAALGAIIAAPSLIWQSLTGFPIVVMLRHQQEFANIDYSPPMYLLQQIALTNPFLALVWIAGIAYTFAKREMRWIGWTSILLVAMLAFLHGKNYYAGNLYPLLIAAGAVAIERHVQRSVLRFGFVTACALAALPTVPLVFPILHEAQLAQFVAIVRPYVESDIASERHEVGALPDDFADMHGWQQLVSTVARVYDSMPARERKRTAILASNWGEAAAIDYYGHAHGLPPALSGANNYFLWGTHGFDGSVVIEVNGTCSRPHLFAVRHVGVTHVRDRWAMPSENGIPISICARPSEPLAEYWPHLKHYI